MSASRRTPRPADRAVPAPGELVDGEFRALETRLKAILDSEEKIPYVTKIGALYYNLWLDAQNPRGLWRRTTSEEYGKAEPAWETVLDIGALGQAWGVSWVWRGPDVLDPEVLFSQAGSQSHDDVERVAEFLRPTRTACVEHVRPIRAGRSGIAIEWVELETGSEVRWRAATA